MLPVLLSLAFLLQAACQWQDEHFKDEISKVEQWCFTKLATDSGCCMDVGAEPEVIIEKIDRKGTGWTCDAGCYDQKQGLRGTDALYYMKGADVTTPRLLYVHGGSWYYGSPFTDSYPQLLSRIAKLTGFVVMAIDYPLVPIGNASSIIAHTLAALNWLSEAGPNKTRNAPADGPPLMIGGDSSGGGSALAALLKVHLNPELLVKGSKKLAGGMFYSPWTNLACNTPEYYSNAYAKVGNPFLSGDGLVHVGDLMFSDHPNRNSRMFRSNAEEYVGNDTSLLKDPVFSPFYATVQILKGAPPMYFAVGGSESILGDSTIFAQRAATAQVPTYLDIYNAMWHVFPMYSEGCQNPQGTALWQALSALHRSADFLKGVASGSPPCPPTPGRPSTWIHYSEAGDGGAKNREWFPATLCGEVPGIGNSLHSGSRAEDQFGTGTLLAMTCGMALIAGLGLHIVQVKHLKRQLREYQVSERQGLQPLASSPNQS